MDGLCFIFHSLAVSNLSAKEKSLESSLYATYITIYLCLIYKHKIEPIICQLNITVILVLIIVGQNLKQFQLF